MIIYNNDVDMERGEKLIIAIDPGTTKSGWCIYAAKPKAKPGEGRIIDKGHDSNEVVLHMLHNNDFDHVLIEMVGHYGLGMAVGKAVFQTCVWIGRFYECAKGQNVCTLIYQPETRLAICNSQRAKAPNIRQALIDLFGPKGTSKNKGVTFGFTDHTWSALALIVTFQKGYGRTEFEPIERKPRKLKEDKEETT